MSPVLQPEPWKCRWVRARQEGFSFLFFLFPHRWFPHSQSPVAAPRVQSEPRHCSQRGERFTLESGVREEEQAPPYSLTPEIPVQGVYPLTPYQTPLHTTHWPQTFGAFGCLSLHSVYTPFLAVVLRTNSTQKFLTTSQERPWRATQFVFI